LRFTPVQSALAQDQVDTYKKSTYFLGKLEDFNSYRKNSLWIPASEPVLGEDLPTVIVLSKKLLSSTKIRYEMQLSGPNHMALFIQPLNGAKVTDWSFHKVSN